MESPKYNLSEVKKLVENVSRHAFTTQNAINHVIKHFSKTADEARQFILTETAGLDEANFSHRVYIKGYVYDVYGKRIDGMPWYIKFMIDKDDNGEFLVYISFHPTEDELVTRSETLEKYSP